MPSPLKRNIIANYLGRFYVIGLGLVSVPLYLRYMGKEAYGLVGFFAMLTGWLSLLDLGLSSTLTRETASFKAGGISSGTYRNLVMFLEMVFGVVGLTIGTIIFMGSDLIAVHWIKADSIPTDELSLAISFMGLIFMLNWQTSIRKSIFFGLEKFVFLNIYESVFQTAKIVCTVYALKFWGAKPTVFFSCQSVFSVINLAFFWFAARGCLPAHNSGEGFSIAPLRRYLGFSSSIAITTSLWVFVTQVDKLVLSNFLSLSNFAAFSIAITLASGISLVSGPFSQAIMPRLTGMSVAKRNQEFLTLYSESTQIIAALVLPLSMTIAATAHPLLKAWTNDVSIADSSYLVLALYVLGNGIQSSAGITYSMQFSKGDLSLHLKNSICFSIVQIPLMIIGIIKAGALGAGIVWLTVSICSFFFFPWLIHKKFAPGLNLRWVFRDILFTGFCGCVSPLIALKIPWEVFSRWQTFIGIGFIFLLGLLPSLISTDKGRRVLQSYILRRSI